MSSILYDTTALKTALENAIIGFIRSAIRVSCISVFGFECDTKDSILIQFIKKT